MLERLLGTFPEVIQLLRDDHKRVRALFAQYAGASNGEKPQIAHRLIRELTIHSAIEERVVYPAFRAVFRDPHLIYEAVEEHQLVQVLLEKLNRFRPGPGSATFDARFNVLRTLVKHHVDEEESRIFPKAEAHKLDWKTLFEKAQRMKRQPPEKRPRKTRSKTLSPRAA
ncbi:MAG TPA: hemerythrin domain-containing protein [Nitrospira sp.]|nr:hemerythrin domain-containing protein [Nitrospira sp.]